LAQLADYQNPFSFWQPSVLIRVIRHPRLKMAIEDGRAGRGRADLSQRSSAKTEASERRLFLPGLVQN